ncbi:Glycosyltransferase involved in cell wall bisynthesis [Halogranum amylolyticum]|uniref:Glycosyltransferase involved in cell wall bisynthesis n=1 Tax=Halogranum amylolyticum TaxID=660520 RepID=A0A1H8MZA2_9EURY|nr:glycosyltransferase family 2 protein [Halogranum amylolyticum]SEO22599.1 Glycosyltransferase involved in cell wall bisynthesis [Halogranum amylolyticum]
MYRGHTVAVVVPAYNEAEFVGEVIDTLPTFVDRAYVVDDHSRDGTWDVICHHARAANVTRRSLRADGWAEPAEQKTTEFVTPIRNERNRGVGYSITTGYRRALADGADVVAVMNGDGQMDPAVLPRILDPVVGGLVDYAKGNRLRESPRRLGMSSWRLFGNWTLTFLSRVSSGYWHVSDSQNGYTAISRHALETIDLDDLYERYGFLNDLLVKLNVHGLRVADVSHPALYGEERSGISYPSFISSVSILLLRNFLWRLKQKYVVDRLHPTALYYALGGVSVFGALLVALVFVVGALGVDGVTVDVWLVPGALATGIVFFLLAIVFDARQNAHLQEFVPELSSRER